LVAASRKANVFDFQDGVYFSEPHGARGIELGKKGKDLFARPENQKFWFDLK
jgi:hypothetical protein